jgi:hypothetical protein
MLDKIIDRWGRMAPKVEIPTNWQAQVRVCKSSFRLTNKLQKYGEECGPNPPGRVLRFLQLA